MACAAPLHSLQTMKIIFVYLQLMVVIGQLYSAELVASKIIFTLKAFISGMLYTRIVLHVCQPYCSFSKVVFTYYYDEKKLIHKCGARCEVHVGVWGDRREFVIL